jgi:hypothetical protein
MIGFWSRFAESGDPNIHGTKVWPHYAQGRNGRALILEPGSVAPTLGDTWTEHQCDFWRSFLERCQGLSRLSC